MKIVTCKNGLSPKKSFRRYLIVPLLSLAFLFTVVTHAVALNDTVACPSSKDGITTINKGTIKAITTDQSSLQVQCQNSQLITISVKKPELQAILRGFSVGDFVNLDYDTANELKSVSVVISFVNGPLRLVTLVVTGLLLYIITFLMVKVTGKNLNDIFVGQDKRLSNSKSQMAIWFLFSSELCLIKCFACHKWWAWICWGN